MVSPCGHFLPDFKLISYILLGAGQSGVFACGEDEETDWPCHCQQYTALYNADLKKLLYI
jgi:hypothetical protein